MSILIVDDSEDFRVLIQRLLVLEGYSSLVLTSSAKEAYTVLGLDGEKPFSDEIELILLDLYMPEVDGAEVCNRIKTTPELADTPVIMLTSSKELDGLKKAFDAGANDFIFKPPNKVELTSRIRSALMLKAEIDRRKAYSRKLEEANVKLTRQSMMDGLTGVDNRKSFDDYIKRMWAHSIRERKHISLLMIDIDHFKLYNDTYGHLAGDDCLRQVTGAARSTIKRRTDMIARYGGEEFAVLLPDTEPEGAASRAKEIIDAINSLKLEHKGSLVCPLVTISIGVASLIPENGSSEETIIAMADKALYKAKEAGRNRFVISEEP